MTQIYYNFKTSSVTFYLKTKESLSRNSFNASLVCPALFYSSLEIPIFFLYHISTSTYIFPAKTKTFIILDFLNDGNKIMVH